MKYKIFISIVTLLLSSYYSQLTAIPSELTTANASLTITGETNSNFGHSMAFLGTFIKGEAPFFAISAPMDDDGSAIKNKGKIYIFQESSLTKNLTYSDSTISLSGSEHEERKGIVIASGGDIDADGLNDFMILSPKTDKITLYLGKGYNGTDTWDGDAIISYTSPYLEEHDRTTYYIAASMASLSGDLNGDGFDDILIGASKENGDNKEGRAYIIFGNTTLSGGTLESKADKTIKGVSTTDQVGYSVSILNDINQDGYDECLIGNYNESTNKGYAAYLFYGTHTFPSINSISDADTIFSSKENNNDGFSETVASIGDINDDGYGDFAIGAPHTNTNEGAIYIYFGKNSKFETQSPETDLATKIYIPSIKYLGLHGIYGNYDYTGDSIHDLIINNPIETTEKIESTYILAGQTSPFTSPINLETSAAYKITHIEDPTQDHHFSFSTIPGLDANNDSITDLLIGANKQNTAYFFELNSIATSNPIGTDTITLYPDNTYNTPTTNFKIGDWVYIESSAHTPEESTKNLLQLLVSSNHSSNESLLLHSLETHINSGQYRDKFKLVRTRTNESLSQIKTTKDQTITIKSLFEESVNQTLTVKNSTPSLSQVNAQQIGTGQNNTSIYITYFLQDMDNDLVTLIPEYRINTDHDWTPLSNWSNTTLISNTTPIQAYDLGELHTTQNTPIQWTNLGNETETIYLRLKVGDGTNTSNYVEIPALLLDNTPPDAPIFDPESAEKIAVTKVTPYVVITANAEANATVALYKNSLFDIFETANAGSDGIVTFNNILISTTESDDTLWEIKLKATDTIGLTSNFSNTLVIKLGSIDLTFSETDQSNYNYQATANINFNVTQNELIDLSLTPKPTESLPEKTSYIHKVAISLSAQNASSGSFDTHIPITLTLPTPLTTTDNIVVNYLNPNTNTWSETTILITSLTTTSLRFLAPSIGTYSISQHQFPEKPSIESVLINNHNIKENEFYPSSFTLSAILSDDANLTSYKISLTSKTTDTKQVDTSNTINNTPSETINIPIENLLNDTYELKLEITDEHNNTTILLYTIQVDTSIVTFSNIAGPNPFNPITGHLRIGTSLSLPIDTFSIIIVNQTGNIIWEHHQSNLLGGYFTTEWDGYDTQGNIVQNGIYYIYCLMKKDQTIAKERFILAILK